MKKNKTYSVGLILCSLCAFAQGQMVTKGVLSVAPNTLLSVVSDFRNTNTGVYKNDGEVLFRGNFTNNGTFSHSQISNGYTRFEGLGNQKMSGTSDAVFNDVLLYNLSEQPAFQLEGKVVISGEMDFNQGIIDNDNFGGSMIFNQNAEIINTWNGSHVNGFVDYLGNNEFTFPIGDNGFYRKAIINGMVGSNSKFAAKFVNENSNNDYSHQLKEFKIKWINDREYWVLENLGQEQNTILTLTWDEFSTTPSKITDYGTNGIHIVRWDEQQNKWIDEGGQMDLINKTVTTTVSGYGIFTLAHVQKEIIDCVEVYNSVTPNGDDKNSYFYISCLENYPNNTVEIYNRWGVKVFSTENYDTTGNVFRGYSDGRSTVGGGDTLPSGTYFYILTYQNITEENSKNHKKAGFLHLNSD